GGGGVPGVGARRVGAHRRRHGRPGRAGTPDRPLIGRRGPAPGPFSVWLRVENEADLHRDAERRRESRLPAPLGSPAAWRGRRSTRAPATTGPRACSTAAACARTASCPP